MPYSEKVLEHYSNPRNVGSMDKADPTGVKPPTQNVGQSSKIESKGGASTGTTGGPTVVAPGYAEALRKFNEGASKVLPKK